ncbi:hypothetical protein Vafri_10542 [Volvox africanus]|uniref:Pherophorin domain-containing protein n=1 Tax=Volvox africanus TaxID=51714 RepID=A0A8J4EZQ2_9CHLO|nr:hypothetical protein Vafri_10542 [Volvox africanus]
MSDYACLRITFLALLGCSAAGLLLAADPALAELPLQSTKSPPPALLIKVPPPFKDLLTRRPPPPPGPSPRPPPPPRRLTPSPPPPAPRCSFCANMSIVSWPSSFMRDTDCTYLVDTLTNGIINDLFSSSLSIAFGKLTSTCSAQKQEASVCTSVLTSDLGVILQSAVTSKVFSWSQAVQFSFMNYCISMMTITSQITSASGCFSSNEGVSMMLCDRFPTPRYKLRGTSAPPPGHPTHTEAR